MCIKFETAILVSMLVINYRDVSGCDVQSFPTITINSLLDKYFKSRFSSKNYLIVGMK